MANPRKFSEKIALHNHRQAEETAAFEKIMKEVNEVTTQDEVPLINRSPAYRVDSRSRARSQGGPIRRPHDRRLDTSPYSSTTYLSPPTDTGWRRTNSDSALHQTTMQGMVDRSNDGSNRGWTIPIMNGPDRNLDGRPKSSCDIPSRVPGISIHTSVHDSSMIQIPIGNNTGSLPDLTNVDFSSPIHAPLDQDHDSSPYSSNHLSVPHRYQHQPFRKNIPLDKNVGTLVDGTDFTQLQGMTGMYQQQCPPTSPSPTLQQTAGYRSPRPSPQSSPSPGDRHSAPCSPGAPSPLPNDYNIFNQHQVNFQQHFEQLSMMDNPPSSMSYVDQSPNAPQMTQSHPPSTLQEVNSIGNIEMTPDAGYYSTSPSQQMYPSTSPGLHTTQNSTGLPEIILTDFSAEGDISRQDSLRQLESELFSEETLREGLGHLDFDEFQILSNPSIGISEIVEDRFRLDHRS